jgi:hypothetical protein
LGNKKAAEGGFMKFLENQAEIETTPLSFQTTPEVVGGEVGKPDAHAVDGPDVNIDDRSERGIVHVTICPL